MYKIIGGDGQEYGPVSSEQLGEWIAQGRVNGQTMVRPEGATDWQAAAAVPELAALLGGAGGGMPPVVEPQRPATEAILARDYQVAIGDWIGKGWELVKARFWLLVGAAAVILLILIAAESIPFVGSLAGLVVTGPLFGGLYWLNLRLVRGEPAEFSDAFAGFNRAFVQLMLVYIVITLITVAVMIPGGIGVVAGLMFLGVIPELADFAQNLQPLGYVIFAVGCLAALAGVVAAIYLTVCWWFAVPLVVDRQMDFWAAMKLSRAQVRKHWWGMFGFGIVMALLIMLGFVLCLIGMLVAVPITLAATMYAYEDLFGRSAATPA